MATAIKIPELGTNVEQVRLVAWLKKEGERINRGEPLCEVETDKAVIELESVAEGILLKQVVPKDTEVEQGTIIAYVGAPGESVVAADAAKSGSILSDADQKAIAPAPPAAASSLSAFLPVGGTSPAPIMICNLAKKMGVDLTRVAGTGTGGRITRADVLKAAEKTSPEAGQGRAGPRSKRGEQPAGHATGVVPPFSSAGQALPTPPESGTKLSSHQAAIASRVLQSHREIPPINLTCQIDLSAMIAYRLLAEKEGHKLSFDAFFISAAAGVMAELPHFRSRLQGEAVIVAEDANVGVAIGIGEELFTPVIRRANTRSIQEIDAEVRQAADRAKKHLLQPSEMAGACLTISNLGMYPVRSFAAVIPPDQAAALAIGCAQDIPVARNGGVQIIPAAIITLSVDHRLINGREAGQFLAQFKERMEKL